MKVLPETITDLQEPSGYLQEFLTTPPRWIVRWGQIGMCMLVIFLLFLSWMIRYPDRIAGKLVITTANPPIGVVAQTDGYIASLLVEDHDTVNAGEVLAIIQSPAHYEDVVQLEKTLQILKSASSEMTFSDTLLFPTYQLGSMQEHYNKLQIALSNYQQYYKLTPHYQERLSIDLQLEQYQQLLAQKQKEHDLLDRKAELVEKDFFRNKQLYASQAIAEKDIELSEQQWIEAKYAVQVLASELIQIQLSMNQLSYQKQLLGIQQDQSEIQLKSILQSETDHLLSVLSQWEELYLLKAPISGQVSLFSIENANHYLHTHDTVMQIVPDNNQPLFGRLLVPVQNFGKVKVGQKVRVYLDNYPHEEHGAIAALVEDFSTLPQQSHYRVIIIFPEGLKTLYGKIIPTQQHLQGRAEIITEERRLLERVLDKMKSNSQL